MTIKVWDIGAVMCTFGGFVFMMTLFFGMCGQLWNHWPITIPGVIALIGLVLMLLTWGTA